MGATFSGEQSGQHRSPLTVGWQSLGGCGLQRAQALPGDVWHGTIAFAQAWQHLAGLRNSFGCSIIYCAGALLATVEGTTMQHGHIRPQLLQVSSLAATGCA